MLTIENDHLRITIQNKGAEMTSFFNKKDNTEHLWQADPEIWPWNAPNLFPVVGECINNQIVIDGQAYPMQRHGFARHSNFVLTDSSATQARFSLSSNQETLKAYPYKFSFHIIYDLLDNELKVTYKVINYDDQSIHFGIGAHPGFNVPFYPNEQLEDYYLEFEKDEPLYKQLLSSDGFFTGETEKLDQQKKLPITEELFAKDALVFKDFASRMLSVKSSKHSHSIYLKYPYFNYLGIWSKDGAPFVCLEPWIGCADTEGKTTELAAKEGIYTLETGHVFETDFTIGVN